MTKRTSTKLLVYAAFTLHSVNTLLLVRWLFYCLKALMTTVQRTAASFTDNLSSSENGLTVYDTDGNTFYFWVNDQWISMQSNSSSLTASVGIDITSGVITNTGDLLTIWHSIHLVYDATEQVWIEIGRSENTQL